VLTFLTASVGVCNREKITNESSMGGRIERPIAFICIESRGRTEALGSPVFETLFRLVFGRQKSGHLYSGKWWELSISKGNLFMGLINF
jgi:hypothetical protein